MKMIADNKNPEINNLVVKLLKKTGKKGYYWGFFLLLIVIAGTYALVIQITKGHIVTGMRDNVAWGLYIANFIFFMGLSYASAIISGLLRLFRVSWRRPVIRITDLMTIISAIIGPLYILLCIGRIDRLHHLIVYARIQSPIIWDVFAISTFLIGGIIILYLGLIEDFALLRDNHFIKAGKLRKRLYKLLALRYNKSPEQTKILYNNLDLISALLIPVAIILSTILSWVFGLTLRPGWNSTIFGPYFVFASIYSGIAAIIVALWIFRKAYHLEKYITKVHFIKLGILLLVLSILYGYFTFNEYFSIWYSSEKWDTKLLAKLFDFSQYGWLFIFSNYVGILLPIIVVAVPWLRRINNIAVVSVIVIISLWIKRYIIVVPTLETTLFPIQDTREAWINYSPTWVEWSITIGGVAMICLLFMLVSRLIPIMPLKEALDKEKIGNKNIVPELWDFNK
ncbi:MAG: polysulfide reductase NrfD [Bacteroidales bacterium]|nr:MAG: polysulfide reductase NrfD [Bacteroidales bacterium]